MEITQKSRSLIGSLAAAVVLIAMPSHAMNPEWEWKVVGQSSTFPTKTQALAYMHSLTSVDPRYPLMTEEKAITAFWTDSETYRYEAPKVAPTENDWGYLDNIWGQLGGLQPSETTWVGHRQSQPGSSFECGGGSIIQAAPGSTWLPVTTGIGGKTTRESRSYLRTIYTWNSADSSCTPGTSSFLALRDRTLTCPTHYSGQTPAPGCFVNFIGQIQGRLTYGMSCAKGGAGDSNVGNPCNAVTGDKWETVTDYSGSGGLEFTRHYHSRSLDSTGGIGVGWSHNYQARVVASWGQLQGIIRPNGYREAVSAVSGQSGTWVSLTTGLIVKSINSTLWHVYQQNGAVEAYDDTGKLLSIKDADGRLTTLTYTLDKMTSVTGPFGHRLQFEYNTNGTFKRILDPANGTIDFAYTGNNLTTVTYPDGKSQTYHYEEPGLPNHLTGVSDENGSRKSTFDYDTMGRAILTERAGSVQRYTIAYNATNSVVTNPLGTQETFSFTTENSLQRRTTQHSKGSDLYAFTVPAWNVDGQRRPTRITDPRGAMTDYSYSTFHLNSKTEAVGTALARTTTYQYQTTDSDKPTQIDEPGKRTTFTYNSAGNVLTRTELDTTTSTSRTWTYTYNTSGQVLTANGPRTDVTDVTTYTYYTCTTGTQCGQVQTITNALNQTTTYNTYNAHGQPLTITDPNGIVTTLTYDLRQRLTSKTVGTEVTTFAYWPTGLIKKATMPDNSYIEYTYDAAHRLTGINDSEGNRIAYTLDNMGNRTKEDVYDPSNALTNTRTRVFNTLNRLSQDIAAAGTPAVTTSFTYDNNGNQTGINAPMSRNTVQAYDELNRMKQVTDPASGITQYGYNALDQLISVTDPRNKVTTYSYNALGDLLTQVSPDTGTTTNTYDSGGNLATKTDSRSITVTYAYDSLNRITSATTVDQTIQYHYDLGTFGAGRLSDVTDNSGQTAWTYDAQGRIASRQQTMGSISKTQSYGYNSAGQLSSHTLPSGNVITYGYTQGKVTSLTLNGSTTILNNVLYEPFGTTSGWTWGNNSIAARVYDLDGKVTDIDSAGLKTFGYDNAFRITGVTDASNSSLSQTYGYDNLDRLTSATGTSLNQSFTYDANGNRLTQGGATSSTFTVNSANNRLNSVSGAISKTYTYDNAGNTTNDGTATFTYDQQGRMGTATKAGLTTSYQHNALGQRVRKSNSNGTTYFVYDEAGQLVGEYDATGALVHEIVWFGDIPVAAIRTNENGSGTGLFYIHADHLNTPIKLTRSTDNAIVWRWDRDPFGNGAPNEDPDGNSLSVKFNLRFPGQYADAETGLYYNYFRDYDPETGRYVESDPIGLEGGTNVYLYAQASPIQQVDPLGLAPVGPFSGPFDGAYPPRNIPGGPWTWHPDAENSRGGTFRDADGRSASWDRSGHWDVDDGKGGLRKRYDRRGLPTNLHKPPRVNAPVPRPIKSLGNAAAKACLKVVRRAGGPLGVVVTIGTVMYDPNLLREDMMCTVMSCTGVE